MKTHPILFSSPMINALLEGRKTQTRRILKGSREFKGPYSVEYMEQYKNHEGWSTICPYGSPGDLIWARETTEADYATSDAVTLAKYAADASPVLYPGPEQDEHSEQAYGGSIAHWWYSKDACPSIHMPRWASRLTLELTGVRVERLQDISESDALAEGCDPYMPGEGIIKPPRYPDEHQYRPDYKTGYEVLWNSINGPGSWERNEWVWVIGFRCIQSNVDTVIKERAA